MEPRKSETPVESHCKDETSRPRQPERKRRFQIIKLEERIAPGHNTGTSHKAASCHSGCIACG